MFDIHRVEVEWGGRPLTLETGKIARQADGAVLATYGETKVLATVVAAKEPRPGQDFFPLTVNYQEKTFAAGKIPGGFFKREGRPSEHETLTSRLIDRPIRPLFVDGFKCDTQVVLTVLSHDMENAPDILAMVAASAALTISGIPFMGPIGGARIGYINGEYVLNPYIDDMPESELDLIVAGTGDAVLMVESEAKELSEDLMLGAVMFGHRNLQPVINAIIKLAETAARPPRELNLPDHSALAARIKTMASDDLVAAYAIREKTARKNAIDAVKSKVLETLAEEAGDEGVDKVVVGGLFKDLEASIVRGAILDKGERIDGRDLKTVRPIVSEAGILPRTHGSALFTRGETQALVVATLGTNDDEQFIDALEGTYKATFMLHYNFPPYSVGETGRMGSPGRREIGHGKLAWRAVHPLLPPHHEFPYTLRVVSEVTESNGSSSMATVCGTSLALMDAGVPLKAPVAGIAMGLIKEGDKFAVLTDILGDEDHLGDMDFKVAGTADGVSALQMDIKIDGITREIMHAALEQARAGRTHILGEMNKVLDKPRGEMSEYAPRLFTMRVHPDKIREVIGKGGSTIRQITEATGTTIDIADDGTITIASANKDAADEARRQIEQITADVEVGKIYEGTVQKIMNFGAFVQILPGKDGLVHISQISDQRVENVTDELSEGQKVRVKVLEVDKQGRIRLSMKDLDQPS